MKTTGSSVIAEQVPVADRLASERGTAVITFMIIFLTLILFIELIYGVGRLASIQSDIQAAAREAARTATLSQERDDAISDGTKAVDVFFDGREDLCELEEVEITTPNGFAVGERIEAKVSCSVPLDYFLFLTIPVDGKVTLTRQAAEPIDYYRSIGS